MAVNSLFAKITLLKQPANWTQLSLAKGVATGGGGVYSRLPLCNYDQISTGFEPDFQLT